ncbi:MAG TPA: PKD domain-containing protein [Chitinophagaceae bacterium]|nr:PKD domain-containing protein [Chitinophagaceae bacterium]
MKKRILFLLLSGFVIAPTFARHLKGGFFNYQYLGPGSASNTAKYKIILTLYLDCDATGNQIDETVNFSFFDAGSNALLKNTNVVKTNDYFLAKLSDEECITGDQSGCYYRIITYELAETELTITNSGYIVSYQRCCRIDNIVNITNSGSVGNTYSIKIPGKVGGINAETNNSAQFIIGDTSVVCGGSPFILPFIATDPDGDSLSYYFCNALQGADIGAPTPSVASNPPYLPTPYNSPFSGTQPMGNGVTINRTTGVISGIAPSIPGEYVISVCVNEYRNGILIAENRKELHVVVGNCSPLKSKPPIDYVTCDGFNINFSNSSTGNIQNYFWDFGDPSTSADTSTNQFPNYIYPDTGIYRVRLIVNRGMLCTDTGYTVLGVYPGFFPGFSFITTCKNSPAQFQDLTTTNYGTVNQWRWDFGNPAASNDTSRLQNPSYIYSTPGTYNVQLIVKNSKGCADTTTNFITIKDKPSLSATNDTLICDIDTLQLNAFGTGSFTWSPNYNISNINSQNPQVSPDVPTKYYVDLDAGPGCTNRDSVFVNVKYFVTLKAPMDTTICRGDAIILLPNSDALSYQWMPPNSLNNPNIKNPIANPLTDLMYVVIGNIGKCQARDSFNVKVVPYPQVDAGENVSICFGDVIQLNGASDGAYYKWSPTNWLSNSNILNPTASPQATIRYILTATDTLGCPKPSRDTVIVKVIPPVQAFAGNDTSIVVGQSLQLQATGGQIYSWSPPTGLNKTDTANPIANLLNSQTYIVRVSTPEDCFAFDTINVKVFTTPPGLFVPNAFTPNSDKLNDAFKPIAVGISQLEYFRVYNRWGQLVFNSTQLQKGWDGKLNGKEQPLGVYVWVARAKIYTGEIITQKGTVTLIR